MHFNLRVHMYINSRSLELRSPYEQPEHLHASPQRDPAGHPVSSPVHMTTEPAQGKQLVCHRLEFALGRQTEHLQLKLVRASTCRGSFRETFAELAQVEQAQR